MNAVYNSRKHALNEFKLYFTSNGVFYHIILTDEKIYQEFDRLSQHLKCNINEQLYFFFEKHIFPIYLLQDDEYAEAKRKEVLKIINQPITSFNFLIQNVFFPLFQRKLIFLKEMPMLVRFLKRIYSEKYLFELTKELYDDNDCIWKLQELYETRKENDLNISMFLFLRIITTFSDAYFERKNKSNSYSLLTVFQKINTLLKRNLSTYAAFKQLCNLTEYETRIIESDYKKLTHETLTLNSSLTFNHYTNKKTIFFPLRWFEILEDTYTNKEQKNNDYEVVEELDYKKLEFEDYEKYQQKLKEEKEE